MTTMIESAKQHFAAEVATGRLTLLNLGIAESAGTMTFWVSAQPEWSSFRRDVASRDGTDHHPITVSVVPFALILEEYGVPHYLRTDIEGRDHYCIAALTNPQPRYISSEDDGVDGSEIPTLKRLRSVGSTRFKLVNQSDLTPRRPDLLAVSVRSFFDS
jgi:hypothetical protein